MGRISEAVRIVAIPFTISATFGGLLRPRAETGAQPTACSASLHRRGHALPTPSPAT
jgi:hypothetical protein